MASECEVLTRTAGTGQQAKNSYAGARHGEPELLLKKGDSTGKNMTREGRGSATALPFTGPSLVLHWPFTGSSLALHKPFTGPSLALHWPFTGISLALHWPFLPQQIRLSCVF